MTRIFCTLIFVCLCTHNNFAQKPILSMSDSITVKGEVIKPFVINAAVLSAYPVINIGDVVIKNHLGGVKSTVTGAKGILLKDALSAVTLNEKDPKKFSEFYLTFTATDGYKIVFSWNELFNSPTGNNTYIVIEKNGQSLVQMKDRIAMITTSDLNTGRRFAKAIVAIEIKRVQ